MASKQELKKKYTEIARLAKMNNNQSELGQANAKLAVLDELDEAKPAAASTKKSKKKKKDD